MTAGEIACYKRHLSQNCSVLEYGSGGSTVLAAEHGVARLYSVDSDPAWLATVGEHPSVARMVAGGRAKLVHADIGPIRKWGRPKGLRHVLQWPVYAQLPWRDGYRPDIVLVDGRFRISCVMEALKRGVPKIVVHDFWSRRRLRSVLRFAAVVDRIDSLAVLAPGPFPLGRSATWATLRYRYEY